MAEIETLARPYAEAVLELAEADDSLDQWSDALAALSAIVSNPDAAAVMDNPVMDDAAVADAIIEVGGGDLHEAARNLVRLLVENDRLALAPAIAEQFEAFKAARENRVDVSVVSAVPFSDGQRQSLAQSLEKRLSKSVRLTFEQDEDIIGGAIIRAGDLVIDGSLRAQLARMRHALVH